MQALSVKRNDYHKNRKNSTVYTPRHVSDFLHKIIRANYKPRVILDPAIGRGSLTNPWKDECHIVGIDVDKKSKRYSDEFKCSKFEDLGTYEMKKPDMVICNPPFNGAGGRKLYSEVFLRQIISLFGRKIPIVVFGPMGVRLNQKINSKRWRWIRDNLNITSIISLPLNVFGKVSFHSEILIFNLPKLKPHYWLDIK